VSEKVGLFVVPSDAHSLVLEHADFVCNSKGGDGIVREFADRFLKIKLDVTLTQVYEPLLERIRINNVSTMEQ
jgi:3-deoxy-D-manno-octulosonate 8-phosphate phosphatase (KDO 8-P phosphatase)